MTVDDWRVKYEILSAENDKLRVLLATSNANCAFCGLPAAEMAKCASGFPGCSRADDMLLCVHPTRQDLLDEAERNAARAVLAGAMATAKSLAEERDRAVERSNFFEAGEARAVYALRAVVAAVLPHEEDTWTMEGSALRHVHRVLDQYEPTLDNQPSALDWLAQQRAEADGGEEW